MAARVGSTTDNRAGGWYGYRASKAAVISFTRTFDLRLRAVAGPAAIAIALHPGTVRTGLSEPFWNGVPPEKLFSPDFAAECLVRVATSLDVDRGRGRCWDWKGQEIPP
jgi:NAD(P)-dependent dehydrogenase (short-subunit alcohol dehydrogenase family)